MEMKPMLNTWHVDLTAILLVSIIFYFYYSVSGFKKHKNSWCFWLAVILVFLTECAPMHNVNIIGDFSAHMIRHVLLLLLCGPLLVISIPSKPESLISKPLLLLSGFLRRYTWLAWITGVGVMWIWHTPAVLNSSAGHNMLFHSSSLLLAGMIFSWPLFGPVTSSHIHPMYGILYLFTACVSCSLLGLLITFAPVNTFGHYSQVDQQAAGLIMWVPCCFVYLSGCIYLLMRWFAERPGNVTDEFIKIHHSLNTHER